jgi:hypothetical protein
LESQKGSNAVWERFATAIKIDRIPLFDVSRHCNGHGVIGRFTPRRDSTFISFFYNQTGRLRPAAGLTPETSYETSSHTELSEITELWVLQPPTAKKMLSVLFVSSNEVGVKLNSTVFEVA